MKYIRFCTATVNACSTENDEHAMWSITGELVKIIAVQKVLGGADGKVFSTLSLSFRLVNVGTELTEQTA